MYEHVKNNQEHMKNCQEHSNKLACFDPNYHHTKQTNVFLTQI